MRTRLAALTLLSLLVCSLGCSPSGSAATSARNAPVAAEAPASAEPSGAAATQDPAQAPAVILEPPGHPPSSVTVEIARTPEQVQRGLMYREHLDADAGMLFLMGEERIQSFWMRNTLIPLDMIFIAKDMRVAGVVEYAEPLTQTSRRVAAPSSYVLEVNGGWAAAHNIAAGTPVRFHNVEE
ncbi:DUF192 domain-containing protein [Haliangium ochraceum]|uniref:DUF192 domain-containing protein n=1 Tax=Haliangium ochraceum (strain DSM 14365 / JCM 11303 / SMP-2) TaxID=502025 RepID=D0LTQ2_HALO1|nr:DUF192 domain-containing protein [Haliangium ochraceum]ACY15746.1 protein of unknown function DUF192 [Haliangium ochraceum DSM 14365]